MGRLPEAGSGKSGFNLAVIGIVALHVVFFGGLLLQGCSKRTPETADLGLGQPAATNAPAVDPFAGYSQPYGGATNLAAYTPPAPTNLSFTDPPAQPVNPWANTPPTNEFAAVEPDVTAPAAAEYAIVKGDTPAGIAKKHGITLDQLREANPGMDDRRLQIGQKLQVPAAVRTELAAATPGTVDPAGAPAPQIYVVKPGDNLSRIAAKHGTTVKELRAFNNLKTDRIVVNQKLKLPPAKATPAPASQPTT